MSNLKGCLSGMPIPSSIKDSLEYNESSPSCLIWIKSSRRITKGSKAGCLNRHNRNQWDVCVQGVSYKAHRVIWYIHYGDIPSGYVVDHIDGNPSNNLISNLRLATIAENAYNANKHQNKKDNLPKGITCGKTNKSGKVYYKANICSKGKNYNKSSHDLELLKTWLDEKRQELHGVFSNNG